MDALIQSFENDVTRGYTALLRAQYRVHPRFDGIRRQWEALLSDAKRLVNGPYLEAAANYAFGEPLENLTLDPATRKTVDSVMGGRRLYRHQSDALKLLLPPTRQNVVVATGTSSGKTRCFQIPILDDLVRDTTPGLRAIIIYPLNALVNDQLQDWERLLSAHQQVTFARFTGQTPRDQIHFESQLRKACRARLRGRVAPDVLNDEANREYQKELTKVSAHPNHLRHRAAIRAKPPHILITNFSMLEYLLIRPVDAPVFENTHLRFIVLDEAHAYRSVQATEIAFLLRRLKDRLRVEKPVCIATSATLGKNTEKDKERVRLFAEGLFGEPFGTDALIYGTQRTPELRQPAVTPAAEDYAASASRLAEEAGAALAALPDGQNSKSLREYFERDTNVLRLRAELLRQPARLEDAASQLFGSVAGRAEALSSLLTLIATAESEEPSQEALLPTRLHYFVRAQDGLHVCLRSDCPGRENSSPAVFPSRKPDEPDVEEGFCPRCTSIGKQSKLVELVTCRRCGWLYGALRDLGPARARANREQGNDPLQPGVDGIPPSHDSFDTDLGWAADSFYTYFSCADELPYPRPAADDDSTASDGKLLFNPDLAQWCAVCGKRNQSTHDACSCGAGKHLRQIEIFHRQCPNDRAEMLEGDLKHLLPQCPNCLARNTLGVEPVRRFSETDDETGIAAAIPLSHFDVSSWREKSDWQIRKLLCFADQRQKAAAFPSLLEDEMFPWDLGREMVRIVRNAKRPLRFTEIAKELARKHADESVAPEDKLLLPVGVHPDEESADWDRFFTAHVFAYFGVPDSARDSAEDFGALRVRYDLTKQKFDALREILEPFGLNEDDCVAFLQTLFGFARKRKAFRLPDGVPQSHPAFGRVSADICLAREKGGMKSVEGFVSAASNTKGNENTNYIARALRVDVAKAREIAGALWEVLVREAILRDENGETFRLYPSQLLIESAPACYQCSTCRTITTWGCRSVCPKKACGGSLTPFSANEGEKSIVARWVSGDETVGYRSLASEEHTAQIAKETAALIEEDFRGQGVNLLSSTTTFEMGINIGDLQKVLLRNAPPNAASYVQRVGRAGRGEDKNAVCVTLCKGTKYDLDCWREPHARLMLGTVNSPTVFLENAHLAQRHLNAFLFAGTLREKRGELGDFATKQEIPISVVIPPDMRQDIPDHWWPKDSKQRFLNLTASWRPAHSHETAPHPHLDPLADAIGGWDQAHQLASQRFGDCIKNITGDLEALMQERRERFKSGVATTEVERAVVNLLRADLIAILAKRGFLPRYAFPLDVVELVTKEDRYAESDVELSRDRGLAIAEYAPGAQVIARKTLYTSGGLAFTSRREIPAAEVFWRCATCQLIRTGLNKTKLKESLGDACPVCGARVLEATFRRFIQPLAFRHDAAAKVSFGRTTPVRQRQGLTHFIDTLEGVTFAELDGFHVVLKKDGRLFRYNCGSGNKGFRLCRLCGRSEPIPLVQPKARKKDKTPGVHRWLQYLPSFAGNANCTAAYHGYEVAYGHVFESFCLVVRPSFSAQSRESLGYALHRGLCHVLQIDLSEVGVSFRRAIGGRDEIILYDKAPGGAGLVKEAHQHWSEVVKETRRVVTECDCERACYDCLKDFANQTHHRLLDRHSVVAAFNG